MTATIEVPRELMDTVLNTVRQLMDKDGFFSIDALLQVTGLTKFEVRRACLFLKAEGEDIYEVKGVFPAYWCYGNAAWAMKKLAYETAKGGEGV